MTSHMYDKGVETFYGTWDTSKLPQPQFSNAFPAEQYRLSRDGDPNRDCKWKLENITTGRTDEYTTCNGTFNINVNGANINGVLIPEDVTWTSATFGEYSGIWTSDGQWISDGSSSVVYEAYEDEEEFGVFTQLRVDIIDIDPAEDWQPREKMRR